MPDHIRAYYSSIRLTIVTLIIKDPFLHLPVVFLFAGNDKIRCRQQGLHLKHLFNPAELLRGLAIR